MCEDLGLGRSVAHSKPVEINLKREKLFECVEKPSRKPGFAIPGYRRERKHT